MGNKKAPSIVQSVIPIIFLIVLLSINVSVFRDDALGGSNQIVLILSAGVAALMGIRAGNSWDYLQKGIIKSISSAMPSVLILLIIGALAGTWMLSGIVPSMIYYGLQILNPSIFLFASTIICITVSIATGSSWTTAATVGIALMGIGKSLGISESLIAGAILSGAYFGDKMSPLSDTTNLAPSMAGTDIFSHIRYMTITTVPTILITLLIFFIIGFNLNSSEVISQTAEISEAIQSKFYVGGWLFIVPLVVIWLIVKKMPALPVLFIGTLLGALFAIIFQPDLIYEIGESRNIRGMFIGIMKSMYGNISIITSNDKINDLLVSGGMKGMLGTIWLILSAMIFGGVMESTGMLKKIAVTIISKVNSVGSLVSSTVGTCVFFNITASDQYLSIVVPGRMYADIYKKMGLAPENLSRTLEDSGTVTSVLVPWNTCGAFHSNILGVSTLSYLPYCFFNLLCPFMSITVAYLGYKIKRLKDHKKE